MCDLKTQLELLYKRYNHQQFIAPDPLQTIYDFPKPQDQEIVGLIASSLAFGNVKQIIQSIAAVLRPMGEHPHQFLRNATRQSLKKVYHGFQYRFVGEDELVSMLSGVATVIRQEGTLAEAFARIHDRNQAPDIIDSLNTWVTALLTFGNSGKNYLLPLPIRGSACKRWHLYLRWMIRQDKVDPGTWQVLLGQGVISPAELMIPLDTHMFRLSRALKMTERHNADQQSVREVTTAFQMISPDDPVRYDFCLTRLGIRRDTDRDSFIKAFSPASRIVEA